MEYCRKNTIKGDVDNKSQSLHKEKWIDIAKGLAILAVMTDHLRNTLYSDDRIQRVFFFSVTLFIMIMGVTTFWSYNNAVIPLYKKVKGRIIGIFVPYIVATFIAQCIWGCSFNWDSFYYSIKHFNASESYYFAYATGPYYYVLLYMQLLLISPVLFWIIKKVENLPNFWMIIIDFFWGVGLLALSRVLNLYTDISGIYAGRLFGGTYLFCIYFGMLVGKYYKRLIGLSNVVRYCLRIICLCAMIVMIYIIFAKGFLLDKMLILGSDINPPGLTLITYAITILCTLCTWDVGINSNRILGCIEYLGKHSLYIFLYHIEMLILLNKFCGNNSIWIKVPLYYTVMICGSLGIEKILGLCKKIVVQSYLYRKDI